MNRRYFLRSGLLGGTALAAFPVLGLSCRSGNDLSVGASSLRPGGTTLDLAAMSTEYRRQLFEEYLPFWEKGGYDEEHGGFMCYLYDDGSVQDDRKDIWYQGRGIWVYSFLYNNIDRDPKWLDMAKKSRDFMVTHMHRGDGTWIDTVNRAGEPVDGIDTSRDGNIYGALFAAVGLIQYAKATGSSEDLDLAKLTLRKSIERYDAADYPGVQVPELADRGVSQLGLRAQGHSFMVVWIAPQLLELGPDSWYESLAQRHLGLIAGNFWNPDYGISNEILNHDYSRITELAGQMVPGHSVETQWMAMEAAQSFGNDELANTFKLRMRRLIEMSWDYVFDGMGDTDYRVFGDESHAIGADFSIKAMWAQIEVAVGALRVYADTREPWALEWYERSWEYIQRTMRTESGVWRQAVDRFGEGLDRPGISIYRKGNFHQPRGLMLNLLQIERMMNG